MKNLFRLSILALATLGLVRISAAATETYTIDPVHTTLSFSLRHLVSKFSGNFTKVTGTMQLDQGNLEASAIEAAVDIASLDTRDPKRDTHVKSPDFLDVAQYPLAMFKSTSFKKTGEMTYDIAGDLTVHGVTKPIVLKATLLAFGDGAKGAKLVGWEATTTIKKSDFGVGGPAMLGKVLGDDVTLDIAVEAKK